MFILGLILLILGFVLGSSLLWIIGAILMVVGAILWFAPVGGRRIY
jgi:hypothetical protein